MPTSTIGSWQPARQFWMLCRFEPIEDNEVEVAWLRLVRPFPVRQIVAEVHLRAHQVFNNDPNLYITAEAQ